MNDFEKRLEVFVNGCNKLAQDYTGTNYPNIDLPKIVIQKGGRKYVKLIRKSNGSESVHCFVNKENGDVLKAASFNTPAKHARGNIFNEDNGLNCMGPYGAAYLK